MADAPARPCTQRIHVVTPKESQLTTKKKEEDIEEITIDPDTGSVTVNISGSYDRQAIVGLAKRIDRVKVTVA